MEAMSRGPVDNNPVVRGACHAAEYSGTCPVVGRRPRFASHRVWVYRRYVHSSDDYLVAGRKLGASLIAGSLIAAWCNSYTVFVNSSLAYGFSFPNYIVLLVLALCFPVAVAIPVGLAVWRRFHRGFTASQFLGTRYDSSMQGYSTFVQFANHLILLFSQIMIGGTILEGLLGVPAPVIMIIMTLAMVLYTTVGGLWASVTTDYLQILAAMVAIVVILPAALLFFGGTGAIYQGMVQHNPAAMQFTGNLDFWKTVLSVGLVIFAGVVVPQYVWQRYYAARDEGSIKRGLVGLAVIYPAMAFVGAVPAFIVLSQGASLPQPDASPIVFLSMVPFWVAIPFAAVILLYVISTADSSLMALVSIWSVDIHKRYVLRGQPIADVDLQRINKVALVIFALLGLVLAFLKVTIVQLFWTIGLMQVTLIGPILLGLFGTRVTGQQAFWGSVVGLVAGSAVYFWLASGDEFTANMLALFLPIIISYAWSLTSSKRYRWEKEASPPRVVTS